MSCFSRLPLLNGLVFGMFFLRLPVFYYFGKLPDARKNGRFFQAGALHEPGDDLRVRFVTPVDAYYVAFQREPSFMKHLKNNAGTRRKLPGKSLPGSPFPFAPSNKSRLRRWNTDRSLRRQRYPTPSTTRPPLSCKSLWRYRPSSLRKRSRLMDLPRQTRTLFRS